MNNKEKFLNKIGKLIEKGNVTEEELANFFAPDAPEENPEGKEAPNAKPEAENAQAEATEGMDGAQGSPSEANPNPVEPEGGTPAVEGAEAGAPAEPVTPEATAEAGTPENAVSMEALMSKIDSLSKALEGMERRNEALENALKEANVLRDKTEEGETIGISGSSAPSKDSDEGMAEVISRLNRGRK